MSVKQRAKLFVEEWKRKYEEASRDGYYPSLWVHLEDLCATFAQQETNLLSKHILELQADKGRLTDENTTLIRQLTKAKKIIKDLCGMVRELNKPNVQLTNVDYSLSEAEAFIDKEETNDRRMQTESK